MKTTIEYKVFYFFEGITFEDLCNKIIPFRDKKQKQTKKQTNKQTNKKNRRKVLPQLNLYMKKGQFF